MESINAQWPQTKDANTALTEILDLSDFRVIDYECHDPDNHLILFCEVVHHGAICPNCKQVSKAIHEYSWQTIRDQTVCGRSCHLEYQRRRFKCQPCGKPFTERLQSVSLGRYTMRYERYIFEQYRQNSIAEIATQEDLGYRAAEGIFYRQASARLTKAQQTPIRRLGVDEISLKKGHQQFVLIISDLDRSCVIDTLESRQMTYLEDWLQALDQEQKQAIVEVSMDMWSPYRTAVQRHLPDAKIVADRFHVLKNLNQALTKARRRIQREADEAKAKLLKGSRWVLVKNEAELSEKERAKLEDIYQACPELKQLHQLKEAFQDIFETDQPREKASHRLADWIETVREAKLQALNAFLKTLDNWGEQILNYFNRRTTQGFVEGINTRIKLITRRGFGYRNFDYFRLRLLIECGLIP